MDAKETASFLTRVVASLDTAVSGYLMPLAESIRRNQRALVFVPALFVKPSISAESRARVLQCVSAALESGSFDRHGRRPRARWALNPDQRAKSKLLALSWRLTEHISCKHADLSKWTVQPGRNCAECWLCPEEGRPVFVVSVADDFTLHPAESLPSPLTTESLHTTWNSIPKS